ncbi:SBBP repeat-containing protein [Telluribacter sp.]|jgi:hypothetical protein|uniref:SBBP repeat-containing protein n=1 Tax=Telluribacter sp. TaxID=1978767 RepID=UPI002E12D614|nr:SBBP repeat-containing protein [Telluribacter sp.]
MAQIKLGEGMGVPNPSAVLELESTNKGFLPPRLTTTQRDSMQEPANGMVIYNTTLNCLQLYSASTWTCLAKTESAGTYPPRLTIEAIEALPSPQRGDLAYDLTFDCLRSFNGSKWVCSYKDPEDNNPEELAWHVGGTDSDFANRIITDKNENVYIIGNFKNEISFEETKLLTASGAQGVFIVKYNSLGKLIWAKKAGEAGIIEGRSLAVDEQGGIIFTGIFYGNATFSPSNITSVGSGDVFVGKLSSQGDFVWVTQAGGQNTDYALDIAVDKHGNSYICGYFIGPTKFGETNLNIYGGLDIFVAKINNEGTFLWAKSAGGNFEDIAKSITVDSNGNVYLTGSFSDSARFGSSTLLSKGSKDIFICKYSTEGNVNWVKAAGGNSVEGGNGITLDINGDIYITGQFYETISFESNFLTSQGLGDIFIAKYNLNGNLLWAQQTGGNGFDFANSIVAGTNGRIYIAGYFTGATTIGKTSLVSEGERDVLVCSFSTNGNPIWAKKAGGVFLEEAVAITISIGGNIYTAGYFYSSTTFGNTVFNSFGASDFFISRYKD